MANLKEVKNRIASVIATQQITKAMKMVAAAKLRKSQERILQMRPFADKLSKVLDTVSASHHQEQHWYNDVRAEDKILLVTISSDRGLCGSFNTNVAKATVERIQTQYKPQYDRGDVTILPLGKKVYEYFSKRDYQIEQDHWEIFRSLSFDTVSEVADAIITSFKSAQYDKIEIIYNGFKNVATQVLTIDRCLPLLPSNPQETGAPEVDYIYQPNRDMLVEAVVPKYIRTQLFKALLDSAAAENGARMTAMNQATENAGELLKELKLTYNRTRQAMITKEISEIVGGAEALKND